MNRTVRKSTNRRFVDQGLKGSRDWTIPPTNRPSVARRPGRATRSSAAPLGRCSHLPRLWPAHEVCASCATLLAQPPRATADPRHRRVMTHPTSSCSLHRVACSGNQRSASLRPRSIHHPRWRSSPGDKPSVRPHPHFRSPALLPPSPADRFPLTDSRLPHRIPSRTQNASPCRRSSSAGLVQPVGIVGDSSLASAIPFIVRRSPRNDTRG